MLCYQRRDSSPWMHPPGAFMLSDLYRDNVFVAGGQPSITYVQREDLHIERKLARALATPNQIVSLSGPTKTGKTVLCRKVLGDREYLWIDGGRVTNADEFWDAVRSELRIPSEKQASTEIQYSVGAQTSVYIVTANGSRIS